LESNRFGPKLRLRRRDCHHQGRRHTVSHHGFYLAIVRDQYLKFSHMPISTPITTARLLTGLGPLRPRHRWTLAFSRADEARSFHRPIKKPRVAARGRRSLCVTLPWGRSGGILGAVSRAIQQHRLKPSRQALIEISPPFAEPCPKTGPGSGREIEVGPLAKGSRCSRLLQ
jgi:hypothetical protein